MSIRKQAPAKNHRQSLFTWFANHTARAAGHPATFVAAVLIILGWAVSGPIFGFSDTWQLIINTSTTIVTFLMVFLIQNTQNRDSTAMHLKLDEIIFALDGAHNTLMNLEDLEDKDLQKIQQRFKALAEKAQDALEDEDMEAAAEHIDKLAAVKSEPAKQGGSARTKKRAERNRKRG
ncbi:low affinity iron permease family protein [Dongia sp.]|uniref:low affinity iron permease family protein n=1 Tax=Dongia sp. TaxID=1977262 RepID=UPI003751E08A